MEAPIKSHFLAGIKSLTIGVLYSIQMQKRSLKMKVMNYGAHFRIEAFGLALVDQL